jgi:hypothetical protein
MDGWNWWWLLEAVAKWLLLEAAITLEFRNERVVLLFCLRRSF